MQIPFQIIQTFVIFVTAQRMYYVSVEGVLWRWFDVVAARGATLTSQLQRIVEDVDYVQHFPDGHLVSPVEPFRHQFQF